jgi:hypothetical protein
MSLAILLVVAAVLLLPRLLKNRAARLRS